MFDNSVTAPVHAMATLSDLDGSQKLQHVSSVYGYMFSLNRNGNWSTSSEKKIKNDQSRNPVHHFEPTCTKLNLVHKCPRRQFSFERNQNHSMRHDDSQCNVHAAVESVDLHCAAGRCEQDKESLEFMKKITVKQHFAGNKPPILQAKRIQELQREEMYWRMPAADKVINRNTFSDRPFLTPVAHQQVKSIKSKLVRNRNNSVPLHKNTLQNGKKFSENIIGQKKICHTNTKSLTTYAMNYNKTNVYKQNPDFKINNDCILKSGVGQPPVNQSTPSHLIDFTKYLNFTRPGWYTFDEDVVRAAGSSVDPVVLNSLEYHRLAGVSSSTRLPENQARVLHLVNGLNRTQSDKPGNQRFPVRHVDGNFYDIRSFSVSPASGVASTSAQRHDYIYSGLHAHQSGKPVHLEASGDTSMKQESFSPAGNRNKGSKTIVNVPTMTTVKSESVNSVKRRNTINYRTRSSQTVSTLDSSKGKVTSSRINILTKPSTLKVPLGTTKSTNNLPKKSVPKRVASTRAKSDTNKRTTSTQISRNSKPKQNVKSPTTASRTKDKETTTNDVVKYPTEAARFRKAAYQEYSETGQRARFIGNVIEVVSYGALATPSPETEKDVSRDLSNSSQKLALVEELLQRHPDQGETITKGRSSLKKRRIKHPVTNPTATADQDKIRNAKNNSANYVVNKSNIFSNDSREHRRNRTVRCKRTGASPKHNRNRGSAQKYGSEQHKYGSVQHKYGRIEQKYGSVQHKYGRIEQKYGSVQQKIPGKYKQPPNAVVFIPCGENQPKNLKSRIKDKIASHVHHRVKTPITVSEMSNSEKIQTSRQNKETNPAANNYIKLNRTPCVSKRLLPNDLAIKKPKRKHKDKRFRKNRFRTRSRALAEFDGYNRRRIKRKRSRSMQLSPIGLPWSAGDMGLRDDSATSEEEEPCFEDSTHNYKPAPSSGFTMKQTERPFRNNISRNKPGDKLPADGDSKNRFRRKIPRGKRRSACRKYRKKWASTKTCSRARGKLNRSIKRGGPKLIKNRQRKQKTLARKLAMISMSDCLKNNFIRYIYSLHKKYNSVPLNSPLQTVSAVSIITDDEC